LLVSAEWGNCQYCDSNRSLVIALSGVAFGRNDLQILRQFTIFFFFCGGFLNQRVYSNNPRSPEDLEHSIDWAFAGTYYNLLDKLQKKTSEG